MFREVVHKAGSNNGVVNVKEQTGEPLTKKNLGYQKSFTIAGSILTIGMLMDLMGTPLLKAPSFPANLYWGLAIVNLLIISYLSFRHHKWLLWLMSVPASVAVIIVYTVLILIMGFIPQEPSSIEIIHRLRLDQVIHSWSFTMIQFFFLVSLGMVTLKRSIPFRWRNWGFILNHLGLWIIIFAAALGSGDFKRLKMAIPEGESESVAFGKEDKVYKMPFAIFLEDFIIHEYPPKLALIDLQQRKILSTAMIESDKEVFQLLDWEIKLIEDIVHSTSQEDSEPVDGFRVIANRNGVTQTGSLQPGSSSDHNLVRLTGQQALTILPPEPREYLSEIKITQQGKTISSSVKVNQPLSFAGWKIYQFSYDESAGKDSSYTVLELIRDPWLPVIYIGLVMMTIGAVYLGWVVNKNKIKHHGME